MAIGYGPCTVQNFLDHNDIKMEATMAKGSNPGQRGGSGTKNPSGGGKPGGGTGSTGARGGRSGQTK